MSTFAPTRVEYFEDRSDGGYAWWVRYDLGFNGNAVDLDLDIRLTGADPGAQRIGEWDRGITDIWDQKVFLSDGGRLYELRIDAHFTSGAADQVVNVVAGTGRGNMSLWYVTTEWGPSYVDEFAAHEFGHMLGAFDEYPGGATLGGYTTTGSLMADFTVTGYKNFTRYVDGVVAQTELRSGLELQAQLAVLGSGLGDTLDGTAQMDGMYGLGGNDKLNGRLGNDFLDAGPGSDTLAGGAGHDILRGGADTDRFVFTVKAASASDRILDFQPGKDVLAFENAAFTLIGAPGALAPYRYFEGPQVDVEGATKPGQRFLYDTDSGKLWYDPDGDGATAKTLVATLAGHPDIGAGNFLVI